MVLLNFNGLLWWNLLKNKKTDEIFKRKKFEYGSQKEVMNNSQIMLRVQLSIALWIEKQDMRYTGIER